MAWSTLVERCSLICVSPIVMRQSQEDPFSSVRRRIAARIRLLRLCRGLSQEALGQRSGLSTRHLQKLEAAQVNVTIESLSKVANALEVDISQLFAQSVETTE